MRSSVIIPSFQSASTIRACLAAVRAQDIGDPFEVFVADSSTDGTPEIVLREFPEVRLLRSGARMSAEVARNWGAREARGAVLAFVDSDCVPGPDWLRRLTVTLEAGTYHGVGGAIRPVDGSNSVNWAGYFCEFREFLPGGAAGEATYLTPNNAAYRSATFRAAGGFPDGYFPLEDQVFYERLRAVGARIRLDPSIVVRHNHRSEVSAFLAHQARIGAANARVARELGLQGGLIASHAWLAAGLLPPLAVYRFGRTVAACWKQEHYLMLRSPAIAGLCALGMIGWGVGFARASGTESGLHRLAAE
jgi:glycosyltransferase involved in cell wall biosynthesis